MTPRPTFSPSLFQIGWRYLLRQPWQSALMVIGITLGVAVVIAVDLANQSASTAFDLSTAAVTGRATHQIAGSPQGLPEEVFRDLRLSGAPYPLAPVVAAYVSSPELGDLPLQLLGVDPFSEAPFRSYLGGEQEGGDITSLAAFLVEPGAVLVSRGLAERFSLDACSLGQTSADCEIHLQFNGQNRAARVVGILEPSDSLSARALDGLILADIATAQELIGSLGLLTRIDAIIPEGAEPAPLEKLLPEGFMLAPIGARTGTVAEMTSAFRLNLTALSLLALVVGLFLIYNTMTFSVVKRRPLFGTLRCLGVTRREVFLLVLAESLAVGVLGSALGIGLGILLGQEAVRLVTRTINDLYFVVTVRDLPVSTASLLKGFLLGIGATVLTAAFPAREAAAVPPRAALSRAGLEEKARGAVQLAAWGGGALIAAGSLALAVPDGGLVLSFGGTLAVVIGFAALTPWVTTTLMGWISPLSGRLGGLLGRLAPRNVVNALSRTSVAVAALMVAVSVTIGISLMVGSFRFTVETWLSETLQGDIYISPPSVSGVQAGGRILPEVLERLDTFPEIEEIRSIRVVQIDSEFGPIQIGATDNTGAGGERQFAAAAGPNEAVERLVAEGALIISEPLARRLDIPFEGGSLLLETPDGPRRFPVAGVYYDYGNTQGMALIDLGVYRQIWGDEAVTAVALNLKEGGSVEALTETLQETLTPVQQLQISPNLTLRRSALEVFDRTFAITSALQGLATLVAFIGVLSALLSMQLEKARELGVLRAIGLTGSQLRRLVLYETGLMGAVAGLLSMPTGFALSLILIYIINRRAFGWTLQLQVSAIPFLEALAVSVLAALLAGVYPALKLARMPAAEVLRGD